jgi:hypothetical protein
VVNILRFYLHGTSSVLGLRRLERSSNADWRQPRWFSLARLRMLAKGLNALQILPAQLFLQMAFDV